MKDPVEVKICGLTNLDDARMALEAGADYLGFVMYARSPRAIAPGAAARILELLGASARGVGVFVNEARAKIESIAVACGLYAVQLHGDETAAEFRDMPVRLWRAIRLGGADPAVREWRVERLVVDASVPGMYGGTGVRADWTAAARLAGEFPVMLAGGLTPDNVAEAVRIVRPVGVDASSGVESAPGRKDPAKVRDFVRKAKGQGVARGQE